MKQLGLMFQLISTPSLPTQPMKGCATSLGFMPSTLYKQQCGVFYVPQESKQRKSCDTGPIVFRPYPRRLEILTICRCHNKGSTFSSIVLRPAVVNLSTMATFFHPQGGQCEEVQLYLIPVQWQVNLFSCLIISKPLQTTLQTERIKHSHCANNCCDYSLMIGIPPLSDSSQTCSSFPNQHKIFQFSQISYYFTTPHTRI